MSKSLGFRTEMKEAEKRGFTEGKGNCQVSETERDCER